MPGLGISSTTQHDNVPLAKFQNLGTGTCGSVYAQTGTMFALKVALHDSTDLPHYLFNDYKMHKIVQRALMNYSDGIKFARVPRLVGWIPRDDKSWWDDNPAFAQAIAHRGIGKPPVLWSEQVQGLGLLSRLALIDHFCPEALKAGARQESSNNHCLVRAYLGARHTQTSRPSRFFSLRNFKLYLNQMSEIGVDPRLLASSIAGTLAIIHWKAKIDARDVEFVLASTPEHLVFEEDFSHKINDLSNNDDDETRYRGPASKSINWQQRTTNLFVIDFNLCSEMTMDDAGVERAAIAWEKDDPYYPKPLQQVKEDQEIWDIFVSRYLEMSDELLEPELRQLPRKFVERIIQIQRVREVKKGNISDHTA